jgi:hypothetical protein
MNRQPTNPVKAGVYIAIGVVVFALLLGGAIAGFKSFGRYQKRADANNNVKVTNINIRKAQQQARIVHAQNAAIKAKAEQRVIEAEGIRKAQDLISKTLTPLYVQHEAIKAQENDRQGDRTYIPVGPQGVPLVANINDAQVK